MIARLRKQDGFSLPEVLAAIVIASIVLGAGVTAFATFMAQGTTADKRSDAQDALRIALDNMTTQVRNATSSSTTTQPIESATSYDLMYLAPDPNASLTNNPLGLMHVRYCLDATTLSNERLWEQTAPYNSVSLASPPSANGSACPSSSWSTKVEVGKNIVNKLQSPAVALFIPTTDSGGNVTDVGVEALVDSDTTDTLKATRLRSSVTIRNLNHAPTATLTCQASTNGHTLCDASASTDPDGQTLSYAWKMDNGGLNETSYRLDQSGLASGSTHSFTVTVTDTAGATASTSQSVTMP